MTNSTSRELKIALKVLRKSMARNNEEIRGIEAGMLKKVKAPDFVEKQILQEKYLLKATYPKLIEDIETEWAITQTTEEEYDITYTSR